MEDVPEPAARMYGLRPGAEEFPLMIVISIMLLIWSKRKGWW